MRSGAAGTGVRETDVYRETKGQAAANVLNAGRSTLCRSADHTSGTELCTEVIFRLRSDTTKHGSGLTEANAVGLAVTQLNAGFGYHVNQASHGGGNTCVAVIAAATN